MTNDSGFVKYDVKCPNRALLRSSTIAGWFISAIGLIWLAWALIAFMGRIIDGRDLSHDRPDYCDYRGGYADGLSYSFLEECQSSESIIATLTEWFSRHWLYGLMMFGIGIFIIGRFHNRFVTYYCMVRQGRIVDLDTSDGGNRPLCWIMQIEGYTYSNEFTKEWHEVSAGRWRDAEIGDWVDLR